MTTQNSMAEIAEKIDSLLTLDIPRRGRINMIYDHFRKVYERPLSLQAGEQLKDVQAGQIVLIATGFLNRPQVTEMIAESDGPTGAAAIARAVVIAKGAIPVLIVEEETVEAMSAVVQAIGLRAVSLEEAARSYKVQALLQPAAVIGWPRDEQLAKERLNDLFENYSVGAFVAIEKGGRNAKGVAHMSLGRPCTDTVADMIPIINECRSRNLPTVGIGDGGNEIGMGNDAGSLGKVLLYGEDCGCGCGGGIIPSVETDAVLPAVVSNWGGYAIAAMLAAASSDLSVMHDEASEIRMLEACTATGLIDGATGTTEPSSDGLHLDVHTAIITLLRTLIGDGVDGFAWPSTTNV